MLVSVFVLESGETSMFGLISLSTLVGPLTQTVSDTVLVSLGVLAFNIYIPLWSPATRQELGISLISHAVYSRYHKWGSFNEYVVARCKLWLESNMLVVVLLVLVLCLIQVCVCHLLQQSRSVGEA